MPAVKTDPARRHVSREAIYQAARAEAFGCLTKSEDDVESCPREPSWPSSLIYGLKTAPAKKKKNPPKTKMGHVLPVDTQTTSWHFCITVPLIHESGILLALFGKDGAGLTPLATRF